MLWLEVNSLLSLTILPFEPRESPDWAGRLILPGFCCAGRNLVQVPPLAGRQQKREKYPDGFTSRGNVYLPA